MLVRRVRERLEDPSQTIRCIGTSATMASEGDEVSRQVKVAQVASTLFATEIAASSVVTETLSARPIQISSPLAFPKPLKAAVSASIRSSRPTPPFVTIR